MVVTGSGKTTVGAPLSDALGWPFLDADDFHPATNIRKMASGAPLTDEDRAPWLALLRSKIAEAHSRGESGVLACSALKEIYRIDLLSAAPTHVIYLKATSDLIRARLAGRPDHFMPPALIDSQFDDLEEPQVALTIPAGSPPDEIVKAIRAQLRV